MRNITLFLLLGTSTFTSAQWSTDPASPLVLCETPNGVGGLKAISDGAGGWFTFWRDIRTDGNLYEVFGQHLDADGYSLWTPNGMLIHSVPDSTIAEVAPLLMPDGSILLAYIYQNFTGGTGFVKVTRIDANGTPLWTEPVELARTGTGALGNIFGFSGLKVIASGNSAYVAWFYVPQGGNGSYAYERVDLDGSVQFPPIGNGVPNSGWGPFTIHDDLAGGIVFFWRQGNGAGAPLLAMRMADDGNTSWVSNVNVSTNTSGLNYEFSTIADGIGSIISVFMSDTDLPMARLDTAGTFLWTPTPLFACDESHGQAKPRAVLNAGNLFVGWSDNRPPAAYEDMYVQKFNTSGTPLWTADGVAAIQTNTYIPTPNLVPSDDGVIATFDGTVTGLTAMRLAADGSLLWPAPVPICTPAFNPFYEQQIHLPDGEDGVVAFWMNSPAGIGRLYAARIYANGQLGDHTGLGEPAAASSGLQIQPSPTTGSFSVALSDNTLLRSVKAFDARGRSVAIPAARNDGRMQLDGSALANGIYTLEVTTDAGVTTGRFIITR